MIDLRRPAGQGFNLWVMDFQDFSTAVAANFQVGDLVINYGTVAVVDGFNNGDLLLKIVACEKDGMRQGGAWQRFGAPAKNCRLVDPADGVRLTHFAR